jgi:hypothetical protein
MGREGGTVAPRIDMSRNEGENHRPDSDRLEGGDVKGEGDVGHCR